KPLAPCRMARRQPVGAPHGRPVESPSRAPGPCRTWPADRVDATAQPPRRLRGRSRPAIQPTAATDPPGARDMPGVQPRRFRAVSRGMPASAGMIPWAVVRARSPADAARPDAGIADTNPPALAPARAGSSLASPAEGHQARSGSRAPGRPELRARHPRPGPRSFAMANRPALAAGTFAPGTARRVYTAPDRPLAVAGGAPPGDTPHRAGSATVGACAHSRRASETGAAAGQP